MRILPSRAAAHAKFTIADLNSCSDNIAKDAVPMIGSIHGQLHVPTSA